MRINNTVEDIEKVHTTTNFGQISSDYNSKNTYEGEKNLFERQPKADEIAFLEHHSILVSWTSHGKKRLIHSAATALNPEVQALGQS